MTMLRGRIEALGDERLRARLMSQCTVNELAGLRQDWAQWAHVGQVEPPGDWRTWVMRAGRGYGKTLAGAHWVLRLAQGPQPVRIALVAATEGEARRVMIEGPSGLLACAPLLRGGHRPAIRFEPSLRRIAFPNGSEATLYSGANPEALRGPQHDYAWCDELAKWRHPDACWDMLQFGLRCGARPRALVTTTPRSDCRTLHRIVAMPDTVETGGATPDNPHLPDAFVAAVQAAYGGTRMGREEIDGELLDDVAGSLWPIKLIEACRSAAPPARAELVRVMIGVDPPASAGGTCGIVACGVDRAEIGHVLADHSAGGLSPEGWARRVAAAVTAHRADRVVAERNQGGDMVRSVLRGARIILPIKLVHAREGKSARAAPVAALFEAGQARLAMRLPELEAQLTGLVQGGRYAGPGASPDRADAMVWALTALMIEPRAAAPNIRLP